MSQSQEHYALKHQLQLLAEQQGRHTELVTVYCPPSKTVIEVKQRLQTEYAESSNIKSKANRKNVLQSIRSLLSTLETIRSFEPNGLVFCAGPIQSDRQRSRDFSTTILEPLQPISSYEYLCDSQFHLDRINEQLTKQSEYGIVIANWQEATLGFVRGAAIEVTKELTSGIPGKHHAGGQSQQRFARLREEAYQEFYKRIADTMNEIFLSENLQGILLGGSFQLLNDLPRLDAIDYRLQEILLGNVRVQYTGEAGIRELLQHPEVQTILHELQYVEETKAWNAFSEHLVTEDHRCTYGKESVAALLDLSIIDVILLGSEIPPLEVEAWLERANEFGTSVLQLTSGTEADYALQQTFGGYAANLRWPYYE